MSDWDWNGWVSVRQHASEPNTLTFYDAGCGCCCSSGEKTGTQAHDELLKLIQEHEEAIVALRKILEDFDGQAKAV